VEEAEEEFAVEGVEFIGLAGRLEGVEAIAEVVGVAFQKAFGSCLVWK
jgi:hypothetical protein